MSGIFKMLRRVFVLGAIAATNMAARQTHTETDPGIACLDAIFADGDVGRMNVTDLILVGTGF
jgi:hypothetical protein